jgi:thymidylate synthase
MVEFWIPGYAENAEDDGQVHGAYGPRLFGAYESSQADRVIELLNDNPGTRRAVIQIFDKMDVAGDVRYTDVPCTLTMQFLVRSERLHLVVNMRSNDAYIGLPHDVFAFTMIQEIVASNLGVDLGSYVHFVGSLHLYSDSLAKAESYLDEGWQPTLGSMPAMPRGSQSDHIRQLLSAEAQLRAGTSFGNLQLPREPYWADLVRLLTLRLARKKQNRDEANGIARQISDVALRKFAQEPEIRLTGE